MPVQHIALFRFKLGTSAEFMQRIVDELSRLAKSFPASQASASAPTAVPKDWPTG
jgi:hypothetical protein